MSNISTKAQALVTAIGKLGPAIIKFRENFTYTDDGVLPQGQSKPYNITNMLPTGNVYDNFHPIVVITVKDPDQSTPGNDVYVDGSAVIAFALTSTTLTLTNDHTTDLSYRLNITMKRN